MERGINDNEPRSAQAIYLSVEEKFEALQDEVNLLKIEIKQTLVDLREFMINGQNRFSRFGSEAQPPQSTPGVNTPPAVPPGGQPQDHYGVTEVVPLTTNHVNAAHENMLVTDDGAPAVPPTSYENVKDTAAPVAPRGPAPHPGMPPGAGVQEDQRASGPFPHADQKPPASGIHGTGFPLPPSSGEPDTHPMWDVELLGNILSWLSSVKDKALSPQQIAPYLQAYQVMGYISPEMAKLIHRSIASLEQLGEDSNHNAISSGDFLECLRQLHNIICAPGYR